MSPTTSSSAEPASAVRRAELVAVMQRLEQDGLNRAAAGNASVRTARGMLITPTGVVPGELTPASMVEVSLSGEVLDPDWRPSSEWRFHRDIYAARPEVNAVVHVHSPYATAQACTREGIPSFHYMIVAGGGADIRCAPYATFGTQALSDAALAALHERRACLLANHGLVAVGPTLDRARRLAVEVEELARQYLLALQTGRLVLLSASEIAEAIAMFATYGQQKQ